MYGARAIWVLLRTPVLHLGTGSSANATKSGESPVNVVKTLKNGVNSTGNDLKSAGNCMKSYVSTVKTRKIPGLVSYIHKNTMLCAWCCKLLLGCFSWRAQRTVRPFMTACNGACLYIYCTITRRLILRQFTLLSFIVTCRHLASAQSIND